MRLALLLLLLAPLAGATSACTSARTKLRANVRPSPVERIAPPLPPGAIDPGFSATADAIHVSWIDGATRALRIAAFDGTAWGAAETVVENVDLDAAAGRKPVIGVRADGTRVAHWFDRRTGVTERRAYFAESAPGEAWSEPKALPPAIGEGVGPLGWADVGTIPSTAWIAPWKQPLRPVADALFVALPDREDRTKMMTGVITPRVSVESGVDITHVAGGITVEYLAETRVDDPGFLVAFRKLGPINSAQAKTAFVEVALVPADGRSVLVFSGGGERLDAASGAREMRPRLAHAGGLPWIAYYTPKGGGEIRTFPILKMSRGPTSVPGRKYLCLDPVTDFLVDGVGGQLGIATLEGGHVLLRRGAIERLTDVPLAAGSRIEWFGHLGERRFIAWVEHPGRLVFAAIPTARP